MEGQKYGRLTGGKMGGWIDMDGWYACMEGWMYSMHIWMNGWYAYMDGWVDDLLGEYIDCIVE